MDIDSDDIPISWDSDNCHYNDIKSPNKHSVHPKHSHLMIQADHINSIDNNNHIDNFEDVNMLKGTKHDIPTITITSIDTDLNNLIDRDNEIEKENEKEKENNNEDKNENNNEDGKENECKLSDDNNDSGKFDDIVNSGIKNRSRSTSYSIDYDGVGVGIGAGVGIGSNSQMESLNDLYEQQRVQQRQVAHHHKIPFFRSIYGQLLIVICLGVLMHLFNTDHMVTYRTRPNDNTLTTSSTPYQNIHHQKDDRLMKMINKYVHYNKIGDTQNSLTVLYEILKISPYDCGACMRIAQLLLEDGGGNITAINKAESMFIRALDCERWLKIEYITEFVDFYLSMNRYKEATALLTRSSTMFPNDANFKIQLQKLRSKLNQQIYPSPNGYCFSGID